MRGLRSWGKLKGATHLPEWRNWQTHGTQNPALFTEHVGSTPTSGTNYALTFATIPFTYSISLSDQFPAGLPIALRNGAPRSAAPFDMSFVALAFTSSA